MGWEGGLGGGVKEVRETDEFISPRQYSEDLTPSLSPPAFPLDGPPVEKVEYLGVGEGKGGWVGLVGVEVEKVLLGGGEGKLRRGGEREKENDKQKIKEKERKKER